LDGLVDLDALRRSRVVVAGLGSGGSTVALELAKAGVGRFVLIDHDRISETNLVRHECDDRYFGWPKVEAVADLISHRNPEAMVETIESDLLDLGSRLEALVADAALVAGCTDAEPPKHLLNRFCSAAGVPAVYAGVYERGTGGEVIRCAGGEGDACYACVTSILKESVPIGAEHELDYGSVGLDGVARGAPGLGLHVRLVALLHAELCLLTLRGLAPRPNVLLFGIAPLEGLFERPFGSALLAVAPQESCLVCGPLRRDELAAV
jgi:molybdopterin/thiamine biosynthesis adenylyltransferase